MTATRFTARYHGVCPSCVEPIHVGDVCMWAEDGAGAVHADCDSTVPPEVPAVVCQTCWLTSCDCG